MGRRQSDGPSKKKYPVVIDKRTPHFSMLGHAVLDDYGADLKPHALATYWALVRCADNHHHTAYPSHQYIAEHTGQSVAQVKVSLKRLATFGLIHIRMRRPKTSIYTILDVPARVPNSQVVAINSEATNSQVVAINSQVVAIEQLPGSYELDVVELNPQNYTTTPTPPQQPAPISSDVVEVGQDFAHAQGEETTATATATDRILDRAEVTPFDRFYEAYGAYQGYRQAQTEWEHQQLDTALPLILEALSWQQALTGHDGLAKWPHIYLKDKRWRRSPPAASEVPDRDASHCQTCAAPVDRTLSDSRCTRHGMAVLDGEARDMLTRFARLGPDPFSDALESSIWALVDQCHTNGTATTVRESAVNAYLVHGNTLTAEALAEQLARVVREYRATPKLVGVV